MKEKTKKIENEGIIEDKEERREETREEKIRKLFERMKQVELGELTDEEIELLKSLDDIEIFGYKEREKLEQIKLDEYQYITMEIKVIKRIMNKYNRETLFVSDGEKVIFLPVRYEEILNKLLGKVVRILRRPDRVIKGRRGKFVRSEYLFILEKAK
jgi:hypothetical protein